MMAMKSRLWGSLNREHHEMKMSAIRIGAKNSTVKPGRIASMCISVGLSEGGTNTLANQLRLCCWKYFLVTASMRACSAGKLSTMSDAVASGARNPAVCGAMRIGYLNRGARFFRVTDVLLAPYLEA